MPGIIKVISTSLDSLGRRVIKSLFLGGVTNGKGDIRTPLQVTPHGIDSNPTGDKRGIYTTTSTIGKYYVYGYLNTDQKAQVGETRIYSTDATGAFKYNVWLRADGTLLTGTSDDPSAYTKHLTRFEELETGFNQLKSDVNTFIAVFNTHTHPYAPGPGAPVPSGPTPTPGTNTTASISGAKIDEMKTT